MTLPFLAIGKNEGPNEGPLWTALRTILNGAVVDAIACDDAVIGLVIPNEAGGGDWADQAASILNQHPKCAGLVVAHDDDQKLVAHLRHGLRVPFCQCVLFAKTDGNLLHNLLDKVGELLKCRPSSVSMHRAREVIYANAIYRSLEMFGHGGTRDITNQFLGPLRMLHSMEQDVNSIFAEKIKLLREFHRIVLVPAKQRGIQGSELWNASYQVLRSRRSAALGVHAVNCLMDLLTECRINAGASAPLAQLEENSAQIPIPKNTKGKRFKLLIIDDHYEAWSTFFEITRRKVLTRLGANVKLTFTPLDCRQSKSIARNALKELPDHDAVLLDIFLGPNVNGLAILDSIRRHYVNVPVILWTSSRQTELPAMARLAHGFLFKKSSDVDEIVRVLARHLREGRARRLYPLPGHFFDQSILDEDNRKCALRFTEYCSKQLDSFHALDDQYFRYFTDHGGRHLFKLLEYLGEALRPLVGDDQVFSNCPMQREEEILSLYLAVFLHEFGMLRLDGTGEPNWEWLIRNQRKKGMKEKLRKELALVRALHALRGMVLLAKKPRKASHLWPDEEGQHQAHKRFYLKNRSNVRAAVALITGHHSRLLPLDLKKGVWNHEFASTYQGKVLSALNPALADHPLKHTANRFYSLDEVEKVLSSLTGSIKCPHRLERLRKQCAIFRFMDAIDVDQSRNPARFLCVARKISSIDRRETLKRQVIRMVKIEGGTVDMQTNVPPPPVHAVLKVIYLEARSEPDDENLQKLLSQIREQEDQLQEWLQKPWQNPCAENRKWRISCHKALDCWLEKMWRSPSKYETEGLLSKRGCKYTKKAKLLIASLTALSVAWEILDEYKAIVDCALADSVKLGRFWREISIDGDYKFQSQKNMLTILFHPQEGLDSLMK